MKLQPPSFPAKEGVIDPPSLYPDPKGQSIAEFRAVRDEIERRVRSRCLCSTEAAGVHGGR